VNFFFETDWFEEQPVSDTACQGDRAPPDLTHMHPHGQEGQQAPAKYKEVEGQAAVAIETLGFGRSLPRRQGSASFGPCGQTRVVKWGNKRPPNKRNWKDKQPSLSKFIRSDTARQGGRAPPQLTHTVKWGSKRPPNTRKWEDKQPSLSKFLQSDTGCQGDRAPPQ
jgi:hypothetical protein